MFLKNQWKASQSKAIRKGDGMKKRQVDVEESIEIPTFTKEQILSSKRFRGNDAASVVLKDDETYTMDQVEDLIEEFMKCEVK